MTLRLITHSGRFHADDVLCAALLDRLSPDREIVRTRDKDFIASRSQYDIVFDVGEDYDPKRNIFDHHQRDRKLRENGAYAGTPYSAFGLIWKTYGRAWLFVNGCPEEDMVEAHAVIDQSFVLPIDLIDNGILNPSDFGVTAGVGIGALIEKFNPPFDVIDDESRDAAFLVAMSAARTLLEAFTQTVISDLRAARSVRSAMEKQTGSDVLVLEKAMPYGQVLHEKTAGGFRLVVSPSTSGGWIVTGIPLETGSFRNILDLPESWTAHPKEVLRHLTGVEDLVFVHPQRFCAVVESKEGAIALARAALEPEMAPEPM